MQWTSEQFLEWLNKGRAITLPGSRPLAELPVALDQCDACFVARAWGERVVGYVSMTFPMTRASVAHALVEAGVATRSRKSHYADTIDAHFPQGATEWIEALNPDEHTHPIIVGLGLAGSGGASDLPPLIVTEPEAPQVSAEPEPVAA